MECAPLRNPFVVMLPNLYELRAYIRRHARAFQIGYLCILANNAFTLAIPQVMGAGVNHLRSGAAGGMARYAVAMVVLAAAGGVFLYLMRRILIGTSREIEYEVRRDFFGHLQTLSLSFFQKQRTGDLMARASNDVNAVRDCMGPGIMYGMNTVTTVVASIFLMVRIDPILTLATLLPLPLLAFLVRYFSSEMHRRARAVQDQYGVLSSGLQENLSGIRVVQSYVQEAHEEQHFDGLGREYMRLGLRLIRYRSLFFSTMGSLVGLLMLILLWIGGLRVIHGTIQLGDFVAFMGYLGILTWPFIALGWVLAMYQRGEAAMARLLEIRREVSDIASPAEPVIIPAMTGAIRFDGVRYRYSPGGPEVLCGIDETIPAGATVAIVGRTGSGKSTLISLVPRLFDPTEGAVLLDGIDARRRDLTALRSAVAVVPQESFLFSESLRDNLRVGKPNATEDDLRRVVGLAGLTFDLESFPRGLDTIVGERGITLSGGQRQRVALARALLADPLILILDDAFSSVDKITEAALLDALREYRKGRTTLLIAHRISTVRDADRILVMMDGAVAESGSHAELLAQGGLYAAMERRQRLAEEIEHAPVP
jgi:ATP-binding cassette subfamily B multidrug efflux pump